MTNQANIEPLGNYFIRWEDTAHDQEVIITGRVLNSADSVVWLFSVTAQRSAGGLRASQTQAAKNAVRIEVGNRLTGGWTKGETYFT